MMIRIGTVILLALVYCESTSALEPDEILVIANQDSTESGRIARYYCRKRGVPDKNILSLPLGANLSDTINRNDYEKQLAEPIRKRLLASEFHGKFRCLLTTYGVPFKVEGRNPLRNQQDKLKELKELIKLEKKKIEQLKQNDSAEYKQSNRRLTKSQLQIARINGKETNASVDSELSMVLFEDYDLYRWQPNKLKNDVLGLSFKTLMVSRLDGPDDRIVTGLVDKAIEAEKTGLKGIAYIDSRGIIRNDMFGHFEKSLRNLATLTELRTDIPVKEERTAKLFASDSCPRTAIYCGWYSLKKYVDAFDFVDGAVGYHIASFEAVSLRDPNSSQWCPSMLRDGITATLGAVSEPYLHS
ncbi:MAG: TIGR03790 family protein, partial [candidate division Zixibacteria bacterium]